MNSMAHLLLFIAMTTGTDMVQLQNENLLITIRDGYKTDFHEKTSDMLVSELVPMDQSANSWTACSLNTATGDPEFAWFKGIEGNDSFYLIQVARKVQPTHELSTRWMDYLKRVRVCDTRLPDRTCPGGGISR
jgi:hypothetical protein